METTRIASPDEQGVADRLYVQMEDLTQRILEVSMVANMVIDPTHYRGREIADVVRVAAHHRTQAAERLRVLEEQRIQIVRQLRFYLSKNVTPQIPMQA